MKHWSIKRKAEQPTTCVCSVFYTDTHSDCVNYDTSLFFLDFSCCVNLIKHHTEQMNDFSHTVTAEATKNIVPLCINRQMNKIRSLHLNREQTSNKKLTDLNWSELLWPSLNSNRPPGSYGFKLCAGLCIIKKCIRCDRCRGDHHQVLCFPLGQMTSHPHFIFVLEA